MSRTRIAVAGLLFTAQAVWGAEPLAAGAADAGAPLAWLGIATEVPLRPDSPPNSVPLLFRRAPNGAWEAFHGHAPRAGPTEWSVCAEGRQAGRRTAQVWFDASAERRGALKLTAGDTLPFSGKEGTDFSGWGGAPARKPLVLTSAGACADPDGWHEQAAPAEVAKAVRKAVQARVKVNQCDARGDWVPWAFKEADVRLVRSVTSARGDWLVMARVKDPPLLGGERCDAMLWPDFDVNLVQVTAKGTIRFLGEHLHFVDAGDYDGDGRSEVVAMIQDYNHDGFVLFFDDCQRSATAEWNYH